jgi:hypothetical protein
MASTMNSKTNDIQEMLKSNQWIFLSILCTISIVISFVKINLGVNDFWGGNYTHYNNFVVFKSSFHHLIENINLYEYYPNEYADLFKYSPTFALMMIVFHYLPESIGLIIWNLINFLVLYYAIFTLNSVDYFKKLGIFSFLLFELILSTQNSQCNALLAGLLILAFNLLEKGKNEHATFIIALGAFIKVYSLIGCLLLLFYPNKIKSIATLTIWFLLLFILPLLFVDISKLLWQYENWYTLLKADQNESIGMSLFAFTHFLLPVNYFKASTLLFGLIILFTPLLKLKQFNNPLFRINYLAFILIWIVVINHKAESPTYVIAMSGIAIWYFTNPKIFFNTTLLLLAFFFTSIWTTDIVPYSFKDNFIPLNFVKSFFPILILFKVFVDLTFKFKGHEVVTGVNT